MQDLRPDVLLVLRRLPRDQPVGPAADRGRRGAAAPAGRAGRGEVVLRAALRLRLGRPPGRDIAELALRLPAEARTWRSTTRPSRRSTPLPTATPTSCRPTARYLGPRSAGPRSPEATSLKRRPRRRPARGRLLRFALRTGDPGRARLHARHGRASAPRATTRSPTADIAAAPRPQAAVPLARTRRAVQEGPGLLGRAGSMAFTVPHFGTFLRTR